MKRLREKKSTARLQHTYTSFATSDLQKKFRLSEFLAEKLISFIAFLSIAIIILIFIFVFKESAPIFHLRHHKAISQTENSQVNKPETYQSGGNDLKPEQYNPSGDTTAIAANDRPEQYGEVKDTASRTAVSNDGSSLTSSQETNDASALRSLGGSEWMPVSDRPRYGLWALILGTLKVTLIAILIAAPIAILAAIYTASFATKRWREIIKPAIEMLAGFPSIVIGFFALMVLATVFQDLFGYGTRLNGFVGGVAMALAAIPIIYTITEDALTAIPKTYSEASLALGATKWQTAFFVTLPAATPGIFAAILLGVGRVFGETMIALMATGNAAIVVSANPFDSVRTLAATIGAEMAEVVFGDTHYSVLFLIGSLLFIFTFSLNAIAEFYIKGKLIKRFQGK